MSHMPQVDVKLIHGVNKPFYTFGHFKRRFYIKIDLYIKYLIYNKLNNVRRF